MKLLTHPVNDNFGTYGNFDVMWYHVKQVYFYYIWKFWYIDGNIFMNFNAFPKILKRSKGYNLCAEILLSNMPATDQQRGCEYNMFQ